MIFLAAPGYGFSKGINLKLNPEPFFIITVLCDILNDIT